MQTVFDFAAKRAELSPDAIAFAEHDTGRQLTFAAFNDRAERCAIALERLGIATGERVAILCHNCATFFEVLFACGKAGAILVPLNWRQTPAELAPVLADCGARLLLHDAATADACRRARRSGRRAAHRLRRLRDADRREQACARARHGLADRPHLVPALHLGHHRSAQGRDPDRRHGARQLRQRAAGDRPDRRRPHRQFPAAVPHRRHQPAHAAPVPRRRHQHGAAPSSRSTRCST